MTLKSLAPRHRDAIAYLVSALVALALASWILQLSAVSLNVPFVYGSDGLSGAAYVKSIINNGNALIIPQLGAPGVCENHEFFGADWLHHGIIYVIGLLAGSWPLTLNLFYLLGYPLAAVAASWSSRRLGVSRGMSVAVGVVYALTPYHFVRGEGHLFLAAYYLVPPAVVLALRSASDTPVFPNLCARGLRTRLGSSGALIVLLCLMIGSSGVYYAAFACFFFLIAGLLGWLRSRSRLHLLSAGLLIALVVAAGIANMAPSLIYGATHEPNQAGLIRHQGEPEVYGLKLDQLLLPVDGHRVGALADIKASYRAGLRQIGPSLDNEAVPSSSIGLAGSIGLVALFVLALIASARRLPAEWQALGDMGTLTVWAILLATVGGLGTLASFVLPELRAYNRISIYIAFIALVALALLAERAFRPKSRLAMLAAALALTAVSAVAVLDQTSPQMAVDRTIAVRFEANAAFVGKVESSLPQGSMVFQMPYMPYPEPGGPFFKMQDYDPLVGYMHSENLRWSYGTMKGRETDAWQKRTSALPARQLTNEARKRGFSALWVDRFGYEDNAVEFEQQVEAILGEPLQESADGRYVVWRL